MKSGKAKLFGSRKDLDGQFHRGGGGRSARKAKAHKRGIERQLRRASRHLCDEGEAESREPPVPTLSPREAELKGTTDLLAYLESRNNIVNEQAKAEGWEFWTLAPEDPDYVSQWSNAYDYERDMAISVHSDIYKETVGFRPRVDWGDATLEKIESSIESLYKE